MSARLFVGNLSPRTTEDDLARFFSAVGQVRSTAIPVDRQTGQRRGFGFVELADRRQAEEAVASLQGRELDGRRLRIGWARPSQRESAGGRPAGDGRTGGRPSGDGAPPDERWTPAPERVGDGDFDDFGEKRDSRRRKGGRHGSDRRHSRGTRRFLE